MKNKKAPKIIKLKKLPKPLNKRYSDKDFQQKIVKKIYLKEYKTFLQETLQKDAAGALALKRDLTKKDAGKLKKIARTVKSNTGFVQKGKLMVIGISVLAILLFSVLFKDMLAEMAAEAGLQAAFGARADISGMRFQVFQGRVSFVHCEVANREKPMSNLFELGTTEVKIDVLELLKGNVILQNIECEEIQWDTPRKVSGALPGAPAEPSSRDAGSAFDFMASLSGAGASALDIVAAQQANLKCPALLQAANRDYPGLNAKWQDGLAQAKKQTDGLAPALEAVAAIRVADIKTLADAQKALTAIDTAQKQVTAAQKQVRNLTTDFQKDLVRVQADRKKIDEAMKADYKFLESFALGGPGGGAASLSGAMVESLARQYVGNLYGYAMTALSYRAAIMPASAEKSAHAETPPERKYGYFVRFPGNVFPKFWLMNLEFSIGQLSSDFRRGLVADLSSDPDLTAKPTVVEYEEKIAGRHIQVKGLIDSRKAAPIPAEARVRASGFPYTLESGLEALNIAKLSGNATVDFSFTMTPSGRTSGTVSLSLTGLSITKGASPSDLTDRAIQALIKTGSLVLGAGFVYNDNVLEKFSFTSNVGDILQAALDQALGEMVGDAREKLRAEYDKLLADSLGDYAKYAGDFDSITKGFDASQKDLAGFDTVLGKKKTDVAAQMRKLSGGAGADLDKLRRQFGL